MKKFEFLSRTEFITNLNFSQTFVTDWIYVTNWNEFLSNLTLKRCEAERIQCNSIREIPLQIIFGISTRNNCYSILKLIQELILNKQDCV